MESCKRMRELVNEVSYAMFLILTYKRVHTLGRQLLFSNVYLKLSDL